MPSLKILKSHPEYMRHLAHLNMLNDTAFVSRVAIMVVFAIICIALIVIAGIHRRTPSSYETALFGVSIMFILITLVISNYAPRQFDSLSIYRNDLIRIDKLERVYKHLPNQEETKFVPFSNSLKRDAKRYSGHYRTFKGKRDALKLYRMAHRSAERNSPSHLHKPPFWRYL